MAKTLEEPMILTQTILDLTVPASLKLSPDGNSIVYTSRLKWNHRKRENTSQSLWIANTGVHNSARKFTDVSYNDQMPEWSPDGKSIAFISDRGKQGKSCAIYLRDLNHGEQRALTPSQNEKQISKIRFSLEGKHIAYICAPEKSRLMKEREKAKDDAIVWNHDWEYAALFLLNVDNGITVPLYNDNAHVVDFTWNDDGTKIAIVTHRTPHIESYLLHGATISIVQRATGHIQEVCHTPSWVLDLTWLGSTLYFMTNNIPDQDTSGLAVYSINLLSETYKYERVGYGIENCANAVVKAGNNIIVHVQHGMEDQLRILNGKILFSQPKRLVDFDICFRKDSNEMVLAFLQGDLNNPTEVFSITQTDSTLKLSDHGNVLSEKEFGHCDFLKCQTLDGKEILEGVYLIPIQHTGLNKKPKEPLPTLVLMHGGPYSRITDSFDVFDQLHALIPSLLTAGFGVLIPNYRGSSGRGERFSNYSRGGIGIFDEPDIVAMTQHAIDKGYAEKTHLIAGGWSQGGYLAYLSAVRNGTHKFGWRFKGIIAGAGITDWDSLVLTSDLGFYEAQFGGCSPWDMEKNDVRTRSGSAIWEFRAAAEDGRIPPILMLHGEKDERVPVSQAWGFRRALDRAGLPFEFVTYPREGHFLRERKHIDDLMKRMFKFITTGQS